jgi:hypothetical protein
MLPKQRKEMTLALLREYMHNSQNEIFKMFGIGVNLAMIDVSATAHTLLTRAHWMCSLTDVCCRRQRLCSATHKQMPWLLRKSTLRRAWGIGVRAAGLSELRKMSTIQSSTLHKGRFHNK